MASAEVVNSEALNTEKERTTRSSVSISETRKKGKGNDDLDTRECQNGTEENAIKSVHVCTPRMRVIVSDTNQAFRPACNP